MKFHHVAPVSSPNSRLVVNLTGGLTVTDIFEVGIEQCHSGFEELVIPSESTLTRIPLSRTVIYMQAHRPNLYQCTN